MYIQAIPAFEDNYIWLLKSPHGQDCVVVDPGQAQPVLDALAQTGLNLAAILITHHHYDHTGGISQLVEEFGCPVYGPDNPQISGITHPVADGDVVTLDVLDTSFRVIACPGHTLDHIAFYSAPHLFCGDTLFSSGCGRMLEGNPRQFWESLQRFTALPDDTEIYCAHEYTEANLKFAKQVEPGNQSIDTHLEWVQKKRQRGEQTLPTNLVLETRINPFLRCHMQSVKDAAQQRAQTSLVEESEIFACLRNWKDNF